MSLFNKIFASIGIGSAQVDTKLEKDTFSPGQEVNGIVEIKGGNIEQKVDDIYLSLHTTYVKEADDKKYTSTGMIERFRISETFVISPDERKEIPFTFVLPGDTPISAGKTKIWVATGLDIKNAVDPGDKDYIKVLPTELMAAVFKTVDKLGFRLRESECEQAPYHLRRRLPFIQEFEFVPVSGPFRGRLDELELVFFPVTSTQMELHMQVDRRARGLGGFLSEALEMDETNIRLSITNSDIPTMDSKLKSFIDRYC
ncbi:sporulation protein [Bacillus massilinigeriensis]|uniref:sporulation protein n=1 Tax=Bacillus mediterraneensis TaxID=1805474 RepID=UPI0008F95465|nr:sporulation protein [Bacillus mediterraneensis]